MKRREITLNINGREHHVALDPNVTLLTALRDLGYTDGAIQCGFCTPGMVISTKALLDRNPDPSEEEIREALSGNLCRCTGYGQIVSAVRLAAEQLRRSSSPPSSRLRRAGGESDPEDRILLVDGQAKGGSDE